MRPFPALLHLSTSPPGNFIRIGVSVCLCFTSACHGNRSVDMSGDRGTFAWYARQARHDGKSSINLGFPKVLLARPEPIDDALKHTILTLAEPLSTATSHDEHEITTWRKYRLVEKLSTQAVAHSEPLPSEIPKSLLPLHNDEFLMPTLGGEVNVDGVRTGMHEPGVKVLPGKHLLFLLFRARSLAVLNYGSTGAFAVDSEEKLHPWLAKLNPIAENLLRESGGTLPGVRSLAKQALLMRKVRVE